MSSPRSRRQNELLHVDACCWHGTSARCGRTGEASSPSARASGQTPREGMPKGWRLCSPARTDALRGLRHFPSERRRTTGLEAPRRGPRRPDVAEYSSARSRDAGTPASDRRLGIQFPRQYHRSPDRRSRGFCAFQGALLRHRLRSQHGCETTTAPGDAVDADSHDLGVRGVERAGIGDGRLQWTDRVLGRDDPLP